MSRVVIQDNNLVVTMQGVRKFVALKSEVSVPLANVVGVTSGLDQKELPALFTPRAGANIGVYTGGTFFQDGNKVFYDLKRKEDAVVITLQGEDFERLVIGVDDPAATTQLIEEALRIRHV